MCADQPNEQPARQPRGTALQGEWRVRLTGGCRRMFDLLCGDYPRWWTYDELADRAEINRTGGTFGTYLSRLRSNGLIEEEGKQVRASETLFLQ